MVPIEDFILIASTSITISVPCSNDSALAACWLIVDLHFISVSIDFMTVPMFFTSSSLLNVDLDPITSRKRAVCSFTAVRIKESFALISVSCGFPVYILCLIMFIASHFIFFLFLA